MQKKTVYYSLATLFLGISLGWTSRGFCHFPPSFGFLAPLRSLCMVSAPKHRPGRPGTERMVEGLELTPEQKEKIQALDRKHREEMDIIRSDLDRSRAEFETAIDSKVSKEEIKPKFEKLFSDKQRMETKQFELMMEVRDLLSDEQKAELQKIRKERGPGPFGGPGGPPPPGGFGGPGGPRGF